VKCARPRDNGWLANRAPGDRNWPAWQTAHPVDRARRPTGSQHPGWRPAPAPSGPLPAGGTARPAASARTARPAASAPDRQARGQRPGPPGPGPAPRRQRPAPPGPPPVPRTTRRAAGLAEEQPLGDPGPQPGRDATALAFEAELAFEGPDDRLDPLVQHFGNGGGLVFLACRAGRGQAQILIMNRAGWASFACVRTAAGPTPGRPRARQVRP
jgi:hypothetical protein